ncbi:DUF3679 domain-containing protein [Anaerobacillus sp. MEB173]|uniref:DUF3679 domain-containing protein n=1 Tax=Anaerobacillus sp. MEB173 TaxID=3383345 RepID=UPI003F91F04E
MVKFLMKCFMLTTILLFGVLLGIYQANNGFMQMQGHIAETVVAKESRSSQSMNVQEKNQNEKKANEIKPKAKKEVEKVTSHDLQAKQKQLEEIQAFNFFSQLGFQISELFSKGFSTLLTQFTSVVDKVLSSFG